MATSLFELTERYPPICTFLGPMLARGCGRQFWMFCALGWVAAPIGSLLCALADLRLMAPVPDR